MLGERGEFNGHIKSSGRDEKDVLPGLEIIRNATKRSCDGGFRSQGGGQVRMAESN